MTDRFWAKVDKSHPGGCWLWTARIHALGYGQFWFNGKTQQAHRVAYLLETGEIPPGKELDHVCHNRSCVNPSHLRLCSRSENVRNSAAKDSNTSGFKGVSWSKRRSAWRAKIRAGSEVWLGYFPTPELAYAAYCEAANRLHGAFAYVGGKR